MRTAGYSDRVRETVPRYDRSHCRHRQQWSCSQRSCSRSTRYSLNRIWGSWTSKYSCHRFGAYTISSAHVYKKVGCREFTIPADCPTVSGTISMLSPGLRICTLISVVRSTAFLRAQWIGSDLVPGIVMDGDDGLCPDEICRHHRFCNSHGVPPANREECNIRVIEFPDQFHIREEPGIPGMVDLHPIHADNKPGRRPCRKTRALLLR